MVVLQLVAYVSVLIFVVAVVARFIRIQRYPLHIRWEIQPVPHEGPRSLHGGSKMEESEWWTKEHKSDIAMELRFMIPEMLFLKALFEHNRRLWYWSFPFHFGLYLCAGFAGLLILGALLDLMGLLGGVVFAGWMAVTAVFGALGLLLGIVGCVGMITMRISDEGLKPFTTVSHFFNLGFILVTLLVTAEAWLAFDRDLSAMRAFIAGLITFNPDVAAVGAWTASSVLLASLLIAYIPLTHMSHFFTKWFTWHKIRWDDEENVKGGRIEKLVENALQYPVSWSAPHINADGKKSWADLATEEVAPKETK